jgi:hypothetical protein
MLSGQMIPNWPLRLAKIGALLKTLLLLQGFYEWPKRWYVVLNATYDESLLIVAYLMASLHSLVDGLRMENRRHQKRGATTF